MRLAIFADIHANRQAFARCLEAARERGAERLILLGDFVGYGGDPEWTKVRAESIAKHGQISSIIQISLYRAAPYSPVQ